MNNLRLSLISILLLTACSNQAVPATQIAPTGTPLPFATATLAPTFTPRASATLAPPTIAATIVPVIAVLTTQVNVRLVPDQKGKSLGLLNYGGRVQVIGKDASGAWWQIIYPENSNSTGWVTTAYVQIQEGDPEKIPVVAAPDNSNQAAQTGTQDGTPLPPAPDLAPTSSVRTATVSKQIFVRTGPAQTFATLGTVSAGTVVTLTGRNLNNVWVQIKFDAGAEGKGWVAAAYLGEASLQGLPFFDNLGNQVAEGVAVANPGQPTLTATAYSSAAADADSEQNPGVRIKFSPDGARELTFSSDLSSPNGDSTDWVAFTPYEPTNQSTFVYFKLECSGNGGVTATLEKAGLPMPDVKPLVCGNYDMAIKVQGGTEYILVLNADGSGGPIRYAKYTLYITSER